MSLPPAARSRATPPVRVIVVDDHPLVRRGLIDVLRESGGIDVCGEAATMAEALEVAAQRAPAVAIVDLTLGHESGLDLVAALRSAHPDVRALVLSAHDERLYAERALRAGALGYVMKDGAVRELVDAVRQVAGGKPYVSREAAERILTALGPRHEGRGPLGPEALSDRERHVLTLVGQGMATRDIAAQLHLSMKTVETHYAHIKAKLGLQNGRELVRVAVHWADRERT